MVTLPAPLLPLDWTLADVRQHVGGVSLERIHLYPPPGMATEQDAVKANCEWVDGILVEKTMGYYESALANCLIVALGIYLEKNPIGITSGEAGQLWILPRRMRIPDVAFIRWEKFPGGKVPTDATPRVAPDLAVEILSRGNTPAEMQIKLEEYFQAGVRLVWYIDPLHRAARVYASATTEELLDQNGILDGRDVLPGFQLRLSDLFAKVPREDA
jgi:Uma2 family endonuclease